MIYWRVSIIELIKINFLVNYLLIKKKRLTNRISFDTKMIGMYVNECLSLNDMQHNKYKCLCDIITNLYNSVEEQLFIFKSIIVSICGHWMQPE